MVGFRIAGLVFGLGLGVVGFVWGFGFDLCSDY